MRRLLCAAIALAALASAPAAAQAHFKGCRTTACDVRVSYPRSPPTQPAHTSSSTAWAWTYTAFDACVVMHESTNNRYADNGADESYYQWLPSTWQQAQRDEGVSFSSSPFDATLAEQTFVFNLWEPVGGHRSQWPSTVPLCGG